MHASHLIDDAVIHSLFWGHEEVTVTVLLDLVGRRICVRARVCVCVRVCVGYVPMRVMVRVCVSEVLCVCECVCVLCVCVYDESMYMCVHMRVDPSRVCVCVCVGSRQPPCPACSATQP